MTTIFKDSLSSFISMLVKKVAIKKGNSEDILDTIKNFQIKGIVFKYRSTLVYRTTNDPKL